MINRENYEAYLLDLYEGRLNDLETRMLKDFLLQNPECDPGSEEDFFMHLEPETVFFEEKNRLKKNFPSAGTRLHPSAFDMFSVARMEGDLSPEQIEAHEAMIGGNEKFRLEWQQWQNTKLKAGKIRFARKGLLKKRIIYRKPVFWIGIVSAAAAAALILTLFRSGPPDGPKEPANLSVIDRPNQESSAGIHESIEPVETGQLAQTDTPVTLSIRKHQDPPELTGKDPRKNKSPESDTVVQNAKVALRPVDPSLSPIRFADIAETGTYDRIGSIGLPPVGRHEPSLTLADLSQKGLKQASLDYIREKNITFLGIASAGIEGFNKLTGADVSFGVTRDENGKISVVRFRSEFLSVVAPKRKPE